MKMTAWLTLFAISFASVFGAAHPQEPAASPKPGGAKPVVQIAVLLDTSNSMDGLIDQAKSQLWRIVNEFTLCKRDGVRPDVQVALYQYGTPSLGADNGFVRQIQPLTLDLDKISEELFKLTTHGGHEYCGAAIADAVQHLQWSPNKNDFKAIFIAGNEPFDQGNVDFRTAIKDAVAKGIVVNTIHCGSEEEGVRGFWREGATLGGGAFMTINADKKVVHIDAPQDKRLLELSERINTTFLFYGAERERIASNQKAQDENAAKVARGVAAQRAITKGSSVYNYSMHCLVDAVTEGRVKIEDVAPEELPEEYRSLSNEELKKVVDGKREEREKIQKEIAELRKAREEYIAKKLKEMAADSGKDTFEDAVITSIRKQAGGAGFEFDKP